jgi:soluble calcium-activated nucleotidase 1
MSFFTQKTVVQDGYVGNSHGLRWSSVAAGFGGAVHPGYFFTKDSIVDENTFRFAAVTDMDQLSRVADSKKPLFQSSLLPGTITRDPETNRYSIKFEDTRSLISSHNEAGRGMELSELTIFQNRLLSFDDRTGTVFEILNKDKGKDSYVVPRFVITEGSGDTDKGMKWEWATVKDGDLYMGSMGKEYTNPDGSIANTNNLWIAILTSRGELIRKDWTNNYNKVREVLGASSPGYTINEAVLWSPHMKKWVFLPRRVSSEAYEEVMDEKRGSNKVILVDEKFTDATVIDIKMKEVDPLHGFSTFAFVPGTNDQHALAIRSVEEDCVGGDESVCKQRTYFLVFDVTTGEVLMDEVKFPGEVKYEGVEFVDIYTKEPTY